MAPLLAVIGDVHARWRRLDRVMERLREVQPDGVLLVGDLGSSDLGRASRRTPEGDARYRESVARVLDEVRALGGPVAWVPGNHDLPDLGRGDGLEGSVDEGVQLVAGLRVAGIGGAGPARFGFCYEWDEDDIRAREDLGCDVLLCHCPPARTRLDVTAYGVAAGSEAIRERAARHSGVLVCGHIHEAAGADQLGDCLMLNAGALGAPFGRASVGYVRGTEAVGYEDLERGQARWWRRGDGAPVAAPLDDGFAKMDLRGL